jgi:Tn3 transposase DDE domain
LGNGGSGRAQEVATLFFDERGVQSLKAHGDGVDESLLQHLSPMGWEHINLTGNYVWPASKSRQKAKFRRLRSYPVA